jgi:eukaryotic-like serine/threonine-protein kinase
MRRLFRLAFMALVLLAVFLISAVVTMRFAIHGREVAVPKFVGMTPSEAEQLATDSGLLITVDNRFYSAQIAEGRILSQQPPPQAKVRRGWHVRVALSLGPQNALVPNLVGTSSHAAEFSLARRGLELGSVVLVQMPGTTPDQVIAQDPPGDSGTAVSPKVNLVVAAPAAPKEFIMPDFVGRFLPDATAQIELAGLQLGNITDVVSASGATAGTILHQSPPPGTRVTSDTKINFDIAR